MVINTVSGELFNARKEPIKFIPCYYDRKYVEWIDRESGGGYVGEHTIDSDILDFCERDDKGIPRLKSDKTHMVVETAYWYGLFFSIENNSWSQCLIVFKSSGLKVSRKWNNSIVTSKIPNTDIQAPRWLYEYDLHVESQKKGNNTWWVFQPEKSQMVNKKLYNMAKDYYTLLKDGVLKRDVKSEQMSEVRSGTGKTKVSVDVVLRWYTLGLINRAIWFSTKSDYAKFYEIEFPLHCPQDITYKSFLFYSGIFNSNLVQRQWKEFCQDTGKFKLLVMNSEGLVSAKAEACLDEFYRLDRLPPALIVDESSMFGNHKSERSKTLYRYSAKSRYKRILTGTKNEVELKQVLNNFASYAKLNLEIQVSTDVVHVDFLPEQQRIYDQLRDDLITEFKGMEITVATGLTAMGKLHQISCGQLKVGDNYHSIETNKMSKLVEILKAHSGKALIFCPFVQAIRDIVSKLSEEFGASVVAMSAGETSVADRLTIIKKFQDSKSKLRFIVANPTTLAFGVTLTAGTLTVYYGNSYRAILRAQSEARTNRLGQKNPIRYIDLVTKGSIDEKILASLRRKKDASELITRGGIEEWI
ncbi:unnamed protein product [Sphagnum tenellum]